MGAEQFNQGFEEAGITVEHHMPSGEDKVYIKETGIPAGQEVAMHSHTFTHKSVLVSGTAMVNVENRHIHLTGPAVLTVERGKQHSVRALTDVVWLCIHATDETDPERIDHAIVKEA